MNEYTPIATILSQIKVPAVYKVSSPLFEGYHEPFWVHPRNLTADMEIRTRNAFNGIIK